MTHLQNDKNIYIRFTILLRKYRSSNFLTYVYVKQFAGLVVKERGLPMFRSLCEKNDKQEPKAENIPTFKLHI